MQIYSKESVRTAVAREMLRDSDAGQEAAIELTAQALALPVEVVREALEPAEVA